MNREVKVVVEYIATVPIGEASRIKRSLEKHDFTMHHPELGTISGIRRRVYLGSNPQVRRKVGDSMGTASPGRVVKVYK